MQNERVPTVEEIAQVRDEIIKLLKDVKDEKFKKEATYFAGFYVPQGTPDAQHLIDNLKKIIRHKESVIKHIAIEKQEEAYAIRGSTFGESKKHTILSNVSSSLSQLFTPKKEKPKEKPVEERGREMTEIAKDNMDKKTNTGP